MRIAVIGGGAAGFMALTAQSSFYSNSESISLRNPTKLWAK